MKFGKSKLELSFEIKKILAKSYNSATVKSKFSKLKGTVHLSFQSPYNIFYEVQSRQTWVIDSGVDDLMDGIP